MLNLFASFRFQLFVTFNLIERKRKRERESEKERESERETERDQVRVINTLWPLINASLMLIAAPFKKTFLMNCDHLFKKWTSQVYLCWRFSFHQLYYIILKWCFWCWLCMPSSQVNISYLLCFLLLLKAGQDWRRNLPLFPEDQEAPESPVKKKNKNQVMQYSKLPLVS